MRMLKSVSLALVFTLAAAGAAMAQRVEADPFPVGGYLIAGAGASLNPQRAPSLTVELAERVHRDVQVYAAGGYYYNLMPRRTRDQITEIQMGLEEFTGAIWDFHARDRGLSFTLGAKYLVPTGTQLRPYIGGGVGVLNLRRTIREFELGDVTDEFLAEFGTADGVVDITRESTNRPLVELGLGVNVLMGRAYLDLGYRFRKAYQVHRSFQFSQVTAAAGVTF